jgi:four helix bundle protein
MAGYRELKVWQLGMQLTTRVYRITTNFPKHELYGLSSQMRRAAVSIPSNIAEGHARGTPKEMMRFCAIAKGSLAELETQLLVATELGYSDRDDVANILGSTAELGRMLSGLIRSHSQETRNRRTPGI